MSSSIANASSGRVTTFLVNRGWSLVCAKGFDDTDAKVVCRELGFKFGKALTAGMFQTGRIIRTGMNNVECQGNETSILQCKCNYDFCNINGQVLTASAACSNSPFNDGKLID